MIFERLGEGDLGARLDRVSDVRQSDFLDLRAQFFECSRRLLQAGLGFLIHSLEKIIAWPAQTEFRAAFLFARCEEATIEIRFSCATLANGIEHNGRVRNATGQRAGMVQRYGQRYDSLAAYQAERRLQSNDSAQRRRNANRTSGIRTYRGKSDSRSQRRCRPAARASRYAVRVPWIARRAVMRILRSNPIGEFVEIRFSEQNGSGIRQLLGDLCVSRGDKIPQNFRTCRGAHAAGPNIVLERQRNPVQQPAKLPAAHFALRRVRLPQRPFRGHGDEGVQPRIQILDPRQRLFCQLHRRNLPPTQMRRRFRNRPIGKFVFRYSSHTQFAQKILSCRRTFPKDAMFAIRSTTPNWFSFRTCPRLSRRYSKPIPQHEPLYESSTS